MELALAQFDRAAPQQGQGLHRIGGVGGPLGGEVGVAALEGRDQDVQHLQPLAAVEVVAGWSAGGLLQGLGQQHAAAAALDLLR